MEEKEGYLKRNETLLVYMFVVLGGAIGGTVDHLTRMEVHSNAGSDPAVFSVYEKRIEDLSVMQTKLPEKGVDFFDSAYNDKGLSEADVFSLTNKFQEKVSPIIFANHLDLAEDRNVWLEAADEANTVLPGGYILQHSEYLDECRKSSKKDLRSMDNCTAKKHIEAHRSTPFFGAFMGGTLGYTAINAILFAFTLSSMRNAKEIDKEIGEASIQDIDNKSDDVVAKGFKNNFLNKFKRGK